MNSDDPKFTAHVLGEVDGLTPAERAEIEALLANDPAALAEADDLRALTARLRTELRAEEAGVLQEAGRGAVMEAAREARSKVVRFPRRSTVLAAIAACLVVGVSIALLVPAMLQEKAAARRSLAAGAPPAPEAPTVESLAIHPPAEPPVVPTQAAPTSVDTPAQMQTASIAPQFTIQTPPATSPLTASTDNAAYAPFVLSDRLAVPAKVPPVTSVVTGPPTSRARWENQAGTVDNYSKVLALSTPVAPSVAATPRPGGWAGITRSFASAPVPSKPVNLSAPTGKPAPETNLAKQLSTTVLDRLRTEKSTEPLDALKRSVATTPSDATARTALGIVYYTQANYDEAISELTKAAADDPTNATAHNYLGIAASQKGRMDDAAQELTLATKLDPTDADPEFNLAVVYATQSPAAPDRARWHYRRALSLGAERDSALEQLIGEKDPETSRTFDVLAENGFLAARENPLSTFSIDVDTASYSMVRRFLNNNEAPPKGVVRIEELLNYFPYDYPLPQGDMPFSAALEVAACPWAPEHRLVRVGLKGREIARDKRPASNLVFLIDVSGSMQPDNKLPLLKRSLGLLIDQLGEEDQVAMVVYAGNSGCVLEPTHDRRKMHAALDRLEAGGSTNGGSGLQLAYQLAEKRFLKGGTNRVILATDGDWNVGITSQGDLLDLIKRKAKSGVFLTVLGVGMDNLKDAMLVKLADSGNGNYAYLDTLLEARKVLVEQLSGTLVTIAKDVKIQIEFNPAQVGAYRLIGYEKRMLQKQDFNDDKKDAGEIGAGHTVTALYEIVPPGQPVVAAPKVDALKYQPEAATPSPTVPAPSAPPRPSAPFPRPEKAPQRFGVYLLDEKTPTEPKAAADAAAPGGLPVAVRGELLTLKLRYKEPEGDVSKLVEFPLTDSGTSWEKSSNDFRFAAAVAGYGMLLRDSQYKGEATWSAVAEWAQEGKGKDATGYRAEFLSLIDKAKAVSR